MRELSTFRRILPMKKEKKKSAKYSKFIFFQDWFSAAVEIFKVIPGYQRL